MPQKLIVKQVIQETFNTKSFVLAPADGKKIEYQAGQFLTFLFKHFNGEEVRRSYSISSSPVLEEPLTITVKRIENGEYSRRLTDRTQAGSELETIGASGFFTLPEKVNNYQQLIFIAAGSGITPIYSLIKTVLHTNATITVGLIYSNTSPSSTIFYEELQALQQQFAKRFKIEFLFSTSRDLLRARLSFGLLEVLLKEFAVTSLNNILFYLCGPYDYMRMITIKLQSEGVVVENIKKEIFNIEKPAKRLQPPDKDMHHITLQVQDREYQFDAQYPVTILQAAKQLKIPVPYSCESGQCGTCTATCLEGKVWMWHNEVLLDDEIAKGRVLTCTGYAVGGDVVLRF
ncbi:oxidoreductase FAD-binding domain-containing protein [Russula earlei]|uniref:Oxidoreductase FAD-binding domain-containing protein n=1 Tax=Russula earlei TaxID=71964 RepID=A0ACC0TUE7_9AGAM|nr:oxidoreductase FAD-binding domain-containing protein [Russula earlei]